MTRILVAVSIVFAASATPVVAEADHLTVRGDAWSKALEEQRFQFTESEANVLYALSQFGGKCQIHMIYDPAKWSAMTFTFVREGKELFSIDGGPSSVFRTKNNSLYFAHFSTASSGCTITAHDLDTGKQLWETKLNALPLYPHSIYSNHVTMGLASLTGTEKNDEGIVSVRGHEPFGDYIEILDRATGKILAHKIYRQK